MVNDLSLRDLDLLVGHLYLTIVRRADVWVSATSITSSDMATRPSLAGPSVGGRDSRQLAMAAMRGQRTCIGKKPICSPQCVAAAAAKAAIDCTRTIRGQKTISRTISLPRVGASFFLSSSQSHYWRSTSLKLLEITKSASFAKRIRRSCWRCRRSSCLVVLIDLTPGRRSYATSHHLAARSDGTTADRMLPAATEPAALFFLPRLFTKREAYESHHASQEPYDSEDDLRFFLAGLVAVLLLAALFAASCRLRGRWGRRLRKKQVAATVCTVVQTHRWAERARANVQKMGAPEPAGWRPDHVVVEIDCRKV